MLVKELIQILAPWNGYCANFFPGRSSSYQVTTYAVRPARTKRLVATLPIRYKTKLPKGGQTPPTTTLLTSIRNGKVRFWVQDNKITRKKRGNYKKKLERRNTNTWLFAHPIGQNFSWQKISLKLMFWNSLKDRIYLKHFSGLCAFID